MGSPAAMPPTWTPPPPRRRSFFGPIMLIGLGVVLLLISSGRLSARAFFILFAEYWPVLLILWGGIKLIEYMQARREGVAPSGIGGGGVVLLIFLILIGTGISAARRGMDEVNWGRVRDEMNINDEDFGGFIGQKYQFDETADHDFPVGGNLKVSVDSGDIKISASSDNKLHVVTHKAIYASSQQEAKSISDGTVTGITVVDNLITVDGTHHNAWKGGNVNLEIMVPKKASVELSTQRGAIEVLGRDGEVKTTNSRGDVTVEDITGNVSMHMHGGNLSAKVIQGDVNVDGRGDSVAVSQTKGKLNLQGEYDDIQLGTIAKGVRFNSSRTQMDFDKLDGDLTMSNGELRANNLGGPFRLTTRSKDVHLEDVAGDIHIEDSNGEIQVHPKYPSGNIEVDNRNGEVSVELPANGNFTVDASAVRGEIQSDFDLNTTTSPSHETHTTGNINKGGTRVQVKNDHGTINIRKQ